MIKNFAFIVCFLLVSFISFGQQAGNPANDIANKIAKRMGDSLKLTTKQQESILEINMILHKKKQSVRKQYANSELLSQKIQEVESQRDLLYKPVLGEQKYFLYQKKKITLINND